MKGWDDPTVCQDVLDRARRGDEHAFRELTDPHRRELHLHCYRILGSLADAEDALQETLLAAWRGLDGFEGRASLRAWLYRIATHRCLNALRDAGRRRPPEPQPPFAPPEPTRRTDVTWLQPYPDHLLEQLADTEPGPEARYRSKEAVELAFVAGLQHLPPRQTAVLVLRDVLGFSTSEVASMLDTSTTAVKGTLQRARAQLRARPRPGSVVPPGSPGERDLTQRFAAAFTAGDVEGVVRLLTDDAWLTMPPAPHEYHGRAAIADLLTTFTAWRGRRHLRLVATRANTHPALACYLTRPAEPTAHPAGLLVLRPDGDRIGAVTWFLGHGLTRWFGLPPTVP
ncbi:RNA polymerase subunit sigma-70 [Pseudonocardia sichuanensis]